MATPAVAGLAALLKSFRPDLSYSQLRQLIEWNAVQMPAFSNNTATGAIVNAAKAVFQASRQYVPPAPPQSPLTEMWFQDQDHRVGWIAGKLRLMMGDTYAVTK